MSGEEREKIRRIITGILIGVTVLVLAYMVYALVTKNFNTRLFSVIMISWLAGYVVLLDVIEPYLLKEFEDITPERKTSYFKYLGTDILGIGGLVAFVLSMGKNGSYGLIGAIVYALTMRPKQKFRKEFLGIVDEPVPEEDDSEVVDESDNTQTPAQLSDSQNNAENEMDGQTPDTEDEAAKEP